MRTTARTKHILRLIIEVVVRSPLTMLLAAVSSLVFAYLPMQSLLQCEVAGFGNWSIVNWLGCHLLHWNVDHLFWDLLMFVVLGVICESRYRGLYYATLLLSAFAIPVAVASMHPEITEYRGLSGLDTAIFSLLISRQLLHSSYRDAPSRLVFGGIWLLLCGKLLYEFLTEQTLFVHDTSFAPIPMAHLVGVVVGLLVALASRFCNDPQRAAKGRGGIIVEGRVVKGET